MDCSPPDSSVYGIFLAQMGSYSPLQGIFLTQGWNPGLLHCRWILYHLSYQGSPITALWRYNSYIIKFTHLKYTIPIFLYIHSYVTIGLINFRILPSPRKELPYPLQAFLTSASPQLVTSTNLISVSTNFI